MPIIVSNGPTRLLISKTRETTQAAVTAAHGPGQVLIDLAHPDIAMIQGRPDFTRLTVDGAGRLSIGPAPVLPLAEVKRRARAAVDANTEVVIASGVLYGGQVFSLSDRAQRNLLSMRLEYAAGTLTLPRDQATADDAGTLTVDSANVVEVLRMGTIADRVVERGARLKRQINAGTRAQVRAITDNRTGPVAHP